MIPKEAKVGMKIFQITYFMENRNIVEWIINKIEEHKVRLVDKKGRRTTLRLADLWKWNTTLKEAVDTAIENNQEGIKEAKANIKSQEGEIQELRKMKRGLI